MDSTTVSVIIPTYNSAEFLPDAINSVLAQTFPALEIIVVDDGSTDDTEDVIKKYIGKITYIKQKNSGPSGARNTGIKHARGEYIAFLDADDIWEKTKLQDQVAAFRQHPEAGLVYTKRAILLHAQKKQMNTTTNKIYNGQIFDQLLTENFIPLSTVLVKAQTLKKTGGFDESLLTAEDTNLFLRIAKEFPIIGIDKVLSHYRKHDKNISDRLDIRVGTFDNLDKIIKLYPETSPHKYPPMRLAFINRGAIMIHDYFSKSYYNECNSICVRVLRIKAFEPTALFFFLLTTLPAPLLNFLRKIKKTLK